MLDVLQVRVGELTVRLECAETRLLRSADDMLSALSVSSPVAI